jgi:hypothetical protein
MFHGRALTIGSTLTPIPSAKTLGGNERTSIEPKRLRFLQEGQEEVQQDEASLLKLFAVRAPGRRAESNPTL